MSKFKVGDKVRAIEAYEGIFEVGAEGEVLIPTEDDGTLLIQFKSGKFTNENYGGERTTGNGQWWTKERRVELINQEKESKMKKSEGITVTKGWAVEVDGNIHKGLIFTSRAEARYYRNENAKRGYKAHVRRTEIKIVKGKV